MSENKNAKTPTDGGTGFNYFRASATTVLRQPQEPVGGHEPGPTAWHCQCGKAYTVTCISSKPAKQWQGLTDQEINSVCYKRDWTAPWTNTTFARAIEEKLKEKNT